MEQDKSYEERSREARKKRLAEFGIHTREQLMEAYNEPFDISIFTAPFTPRKKKNESKKVDEKKTNK